MADASAFDWVCDELERLTDLDRLETRGTVRLALRRAGLEAKTVTSDEMAVVLERVLPGELAARAIEDAASICENLSASLPRADTPGAGAVHSPEEVFRRMG